MNENISGVDGNRAIKRKERDLDSQVSCQAMGRLPTWMVKDQPGTTIYPNDNDTGGQSKLQRPGFVRMNAVTQRQRQDRNTWLNPSATPIVNWSAAQKTTLRLFSTK